MRSLKLVSYIAVLVLTAYGSFVFNHPIVCALNDYFGLTFSVSKGSQRDVVVPDILIDSLRDNLAHTEGLNDSEKEEILREVPNKVDFEFKNQGPYKNIFDYSVFDKTDKKGGILFVGDSTISWGFSLSHFSNASGIEAHSLAFGMNVMDETLLKATEKIVQCYYAEPPTVILSNSLQDMGNPKRPNRPQDKALEAIAKTRSCGELYNLVSKGAGKSHRMLNFADIFDFRKYRSQVASFGDGENPLEHVSLHKIMEPDKFKDMDIHSDWSFVRWMPEFRIPLIVVSNPKQERYPRWHPSERRKARQFYFNYFRANKANARLIAERTQKWASRDVCFLIPVTLDPEVAIRKAFLPKSACVVNFVAIARKHYRSTKLYMQSNNHFADSAGIVFAALAGKDVGQMNLPKWH